MSECFTGNRQLFEVKDDIIKEDMISNTDILGSIDLQIS